MFIRHLQSNSFTIVLWGNIFSCVIFDCLMSIAERLEIIYFEHFLILNSNQDMIFLITKTLSADLLLRFIEY